MRVNPIDLHRRCRAAAAAAAERGGSFSDDDLRAELGRECLTDDRWSRYRTVAITTPHGVTVLRLHLISTSHTESVEGRGDGLEARGAGGGSLLRELMIQSRWRAKRPGRREFWP